MQYILPPSQIRVHAVHWGPGGRQIKRKGRTKVCFIHQSSPCALSQTQLGGGPLSTFLMQSRDKPLQILAMLAGVIGTMVVVTVTTFLPVYLFLYLPTCLSTSLPTRLPICIPACLSVYLLTCSPS